MNRFCLLAVVLLVVSRTATAESRSVSHSAWQIAQNQVTVRFVMPVAEATQLAARGQPAPAAEKVAAYVLEHLSISASGVACTAIDQGYDIGRINTLSMGAELFAFEIIYRCPNPAGMLLTNRVLFDQNPRHLDFARIENDGVVIAQLFSARRQQLAIAESAATSAGFAAYAQAGAKHVLRGIERICFLAGLLLIARTRRNLSSACACLILGYGLSVAIAIGADLVPSIPAIESAIGLLTLLITAQVVVLHGRRPRLTAAFIGGALLILSAVAILAQRGEFAALLLGFGIFAAGFVGISADQNRRAWLVLPATFGFLDGFTLTGDYARLRIWQELTPANLLAFNAGAACTGVFLVAAFCAASIWPARMAWPARIVARIVARMNILRLRAAIEDVAATALAGMGAFWMLAGLAANFRI
jgi:hypothetical protein